MLLRHAATMSSRLLILELWILASCASRTEQLAHPDLRVFEGATLIDATGSAPKDSAVLVSAADRIHPRKAALPADPPRHAGGTTENLPQLRQGVETPQQRKQPERNDFRNLHGRGRTRTYDLTDVNRAL
jgi:hypothetical protein